MSSWQEAKVARWLSVAISVLAVASLVSELAFLSDRMSGGGTGGLLVQVLLLYLAVGIVGWLPLVAVPISWIGLVSVFATGLPWLGCIAAWVVAVVALAVLRLPVGLVHVGVYLVWAIPMNLVEVGDRGDQFFWQALLGMLPAAGVGLALRFLVVRQREERRRLVELEQRNDKIRREERRALARELHDVVAHQLTLITMQVTSRWRSRDPEELSTTLHSIDDAARAALVELRVLLDVLREESPHPGERVGVDPLGPPGGVSVVRLVTRLSEQLSDLGFRIHRVDIDPLVDTMPTSLITTSTRIFQEAITNIVKHAPSGSVCEFGLTLQDKVATIVVINDLPRDHTQRPVAAGLAADVVGQGTTGYGLQGMRERVAMLGGVSQVGARDGRWVVRADMPILMDFSPSDVVAER